MKVALYMRVSLDDGTQTVENQRLALREFCARMNWTIVSEFEDQRTGKNVNRPGLTALLKAASKKEFDLVCFWDLSRLTRSGVSDTLRILEQLRSWGVGFRSLQEPYLDSSGPFSDAIISIIASIAKIEREKISERTKAGLARARKNGKTLGRPRLDDKRVFELHAQGMKPKEIASLLTYVDKNGQLENYHEVTVRRILSPSLRKSA